MIFVKNTQDEVTRFSEFYKAIDGQKADLLPVEQLSEELEYQYDGFDFDSKTWRKAFYNMDVDFDNRVTHQNFIIACSQYFMKENDKKIKDLFNQLDTNGDGFIDVQEMKAFYQDENLGESGASSTREAQIWQQILDELEKEGNAMVAYRNFHSALGGVIQRGAIDPDTVQMIGSTRKSIIQV